MKHNSTFLNFPFNDGMRYNLVTYSIIAGMCTRVDILQTYLFACYDAISDLMMRLKLLTTISINFIHAHEPTPTPTRICCWRIVGTEL